jgi:hypothetical protein
MLLGALSCLINNSPNDNDWFSSADFPPISY